MLVVMRLIGLVAMPELHHLSPALGGQVFPCLDPSAWQKLSMTGLALQFYLLR
jgi:hypothetical protein